MKLAGRENKQEESRLEGMREKGESKGDTGGRPAWYRVGHTK